MNKTKNNMIMDSFRKSEPLLEALEKTVLEELNQGLKRSGIRLQGIEHRIKERDSLREKISRKNDKYDSLYDITDLLGIRIICYFAEDVDRIAAVVGKLFDVDRENSVDERKEIGPNNFGYLSLHYICSLKKNGKYPEGLTEIPFEIQMRSSLQNIWAEIEHDFGYKNDFGIPKSVQREFAQVAGLLEVADKCFDEIRTKMNRYEHAVRKEISNDKAQALPLDHISLKEFMQHSPQFRKFMSLIKGNSRKKMIMVSPDTYLESLDLLGIHTIGDLLTALDAQQEHALELFEDMKKEQEMDELVSTVGLYLLCQAMLVWGDKTERQILKYYRKISRSEGQAERRTKRILSIRQNKQLS